MKHKFLQGDAFESLENNLAPDFLPSSSEIHHNARPGPIPIVMNQGTAPTSGASLPGSTVSVTSGGMTINLLFDAAAMAAPTTFRDGIQQAASILAGNIFDKITVNLMIDYSGSGGGAFAGPDNGAYESYSLIRSDLVNSAPAGDTTFNFLPGGSTIQGQSNVAVWNAQLKLFGLLGATDTSTDDGGATFATDISPNLLVGLALHELTHALGRVPDGPAPDIFDLFRFTAPGVRLFQDANTAPPSYFSLDGGVTKLADFGQKSDPSDFLNRGIQGSNDPFDEFYTGSTSQALTKVDLALLHALAFHTGPTTFDALEYLASNTDLIQAFGFNLAAAEQHYNTTGVYEHRSTNSFDAAEYLASNADLIQAFGFNLVAAEQHYVQSGFNEHRATRSFDAAEYLASNTDLIQQFGFNLAAAEQQYVQTGFNEHRATNSFDPIEYLASNTDLIQQFGFNLAAAEQQYVQTGFNAHRATNSFDAIEYLASNPDLIKAFGLNTAAAEQHYVQSGYNEGRATHSFNAAQYLANYPDLVSAFGNNLVAAEQHYVTNGFNEGRTDQAPVINGDGGANTLVAKNGAIMTGGAGADTFVFNASLLTPATINDFAVGTDHLQLSASGFGHGLTPGGTVSLVAAATAGAATHSGTGGYFIFDNAHTLSWDPTGGSGADAIALAKLIGVSTLHTTDFLLV